MFVITEIFKPQLFSSHTQYVLTQDWLNYFWIAVDCFVLPFISHGKQMNVLEGKCLCLLQISIIVNKSLAVLLSSILFIHYFFILYFVVASLLLNSLFWYRCCCGLFTSLFFLFCYTNVVAIFLFTRWSCKQADYFCFWSFCFSV